MLVQKVAAQLRSNMLMTVYVGSAPLWVQWGCSAVCSLTKDRQGKTSCAWHASMRAAIAMQHV